MYIRMHIHTYICLAFFFSAKPTPAGQGKFIIE